MNSQKRNDMGSKTQKVLNAMIAGRHISLVDSEEFQLSQMHTAICKIRKRILHNSLPFVMRDRWITIGENKVQYKEYWLEEKETI